MKRAKYYRCPKCQKKQLFDFWELCCKCGYTEKQTTLLKWS